MRTNIFSRLVDLTLAIGRTRAGRPLTTNIIDCIKNAPSLKYRTIERSKLTIDDFEQIHNNGKQLSTLKITGSIISVLSHYILPQSIAPADKLTTLILDQRTEIFDKNCRFMDYIIAKYPNLIHFEFLIIIHPRFAKRYNTLIDGICLFG